MSWGFCLEYNETGCSWRHGMLQLRSSLKIGQALQSTRYKAHESFSAWVTRRTGEPCKNGSLNACSKWHNKAHSASAAATPRVAEAAVPLSAISDAVNPSTGTAAVSANAATAQSGVRAADPSPRTVVHLVEAANAPSTLCAQGSSAGAASASAVEIQPPSHQILALQTSPQVLYLSQQEQRLTHQ